MDGKSAEASGTKETEITANALKTTGTSGVSLDGNREDEVSKLIYFRQSEQLSKMDGKSAEASGTKETEITADSPKATGTSGVSLDGNREDEVSKLWNFTLFLIIQHALHIDASHTERAVTIVHDNIQLKAKEGVSESKVKAFMKNFDNDRAKFHRDLLIYFNKYNIHDSRLERKYVMVGEKTVVGCCGAAHAVKHPLENEISGKSLEQLEDFVKVPDGPNEKSELEKFVEKRTNSQERIITIVASPDRVSIMKSKRVSRFNPNFPLTKIETSFDVIKNSFCACGIEAEAAISFAGTEDIFQRNEPFHPISRTDVTNTLRDNIRRIMKHAFQSEGHHDGEHAISSSFYSLTVSNIGIQEYFDENAD
ncbi:hypothetical protein Ddc_11605 [Ditylenchus destructor]|nr:hypothetical protein Ddc_11605 [Ditylenchus destructor]